MSNLNRIKLPSNLDDVTVEAVEKADKESKVKKNRNKIIAASIAGLLIAGGAMNNEAVSAAVKEISSKIESMYNKEYNAKLDPNELAEYKAIIGKTVEDKGAKITLNEFYMDEETAYAQVTTDLRGLGEKAIGNRHMKVYINGKEVDSNVTGGEPHTSGIGYTESFSVNEDGTTDTLLSYDMKKIDLSKVEDVKVVFEKIKAIDRFVDKNNKEFDYFTTKLNDKDEIRKVEAEINKGLDDGSITGIPGKEIEGNWEFAFKYDASKIANKIRKAEVNKSVTINNTKLDVKDVTVTPGKVILNYKMKELDTGNNETNKSTKFVLKDKDGRKVESSGGYSGEGDIVKDEFKLATKDLDIVEIIPSIEEWTIEDYFRKVINTVYDEKNTIKVNLNK